MVFVEEGLRNGRGGRGGVLLHPATPMGAPALEGAAVAAENDLMQNRTTLFQKRTVYSSPYFFILRHRDARSMPRICAASVRTPPVSLST